jgi:hypothetical protein
MSDIKEEVLTVCSMERNGNDINGNARYKIYLYGPCGFEIATGKAHLQNQCSTNFREPKKMLVTYRFTKKNRKMIVLDLKGLWEE